jgi:hypothetical protein
MRPRWTPELKYIQPGHPTQNGFIERFNRTSREEVLDACLFEPVAEVRGLSDEWLRFYNERWPQEALGSVPPVHFRPRAAPRGESTTPMFTDWGAGPPPFEMKLRRESKRGRGDGSTRR